MHKNLRGFKDLIKHGGFLKSRIINLSVIISTIGSLLLVLIFDIKYVCYIQEVVQLINSLVPSLLGITIAGYSFLMTFIPDRLMKRMTQPLSADKLSFYQYVTSSLAMNILQHALILICSVGIYLVIFIQTDNKIFFHGPLILWVNRGVFVFTNGLLAGALGIVVQIIVSSFDLAQLYHYDASLRNDNS